MASLVNMKKPKPKKEAKRHAECEIGMPYHEKYPYGLKVELGTDELNKLGIDISKMQTGTVIMIEARTEVKKVEQIDTIDDYTGKMKTRKELGLQITDIHLAEGEPKKSRTTLRALKANFK